MDMADVQRTSWIAIRSGRVNYRHAFSLLCPFTHAHTHTHTLSLSLSLSDFLAPLRRRAQPDAAAATYNNASTLYRSTG